MRRGASTAMLDRESRLMPFCLRDGLLHPVSQQQPVRQPAEGVVRRDVLKLYVRFAELFVVFASSGLEVGVVEKTATMRQSFAPSSRSLTTYTSR